MLHAVFARQLLNVNVYTQHIDLQIVYDTHSTHSQCTNVIFYTSFPICNWMLATIIIHHRIAIRLLIYIHTLCMFCERERAYCHSLFVCRNLPTILCKYVFGNGKFAYIFVCIFKCCLKCQKEMLENFTD